MKYKYRWKLVDFLQWLEQKIRQFAYYIDQKSWELHYYLINKQTLEIVDMSS